MDNERILSMDEMERSFETVQIALEKIKKVQMSVEQYQAQRRQMTPFKTVTTGMKRVVCLYRVSTKKQVKDEKDTLPVQRKMCREYIATKPDWQLIDERLEPGISAFKKPFAKREALKMLEADAIEKYYDILLVVTMDRFGRRGIETAYKMKEFYDHGAEIWSIDDNTCLNSPTSLSKLLLMFKSWKAEEDSEGTSFKVKHTHIQYAKEGRYRGGTTPYGYDAVFTGKYSPKGVPNLKLQINETEASVVKTMFGLVNNKGWGSRRIMTYLNEELQVKTKIGAYWSQSSVKTILRNSIYKGYQSYNKTRRDKNDVFHTNPKDTWIYAGERNQDLVIIPDEIWDSVNELREGKAQDRIPKHNYSQVYGVKSPLLLMGIARCGHCKRMYTTSYNYSRWKKMNHETNEKEDHVKITPIYKCSSKLERKMDENGVYICDGQTTYIASSIEDDVIDEAKIFVKELQKVDFSNDMNKKSEERKKELEKRISMKAKEFAQLSIREGNIENQMMDIPNDDPIVARVLKKKYGELLVKLQEDQSRIQIELDELKSEYSQKKIDESVIKVVQSELKDWEQTFDAVGPEQKRMMLSRIIESVLVYKREENEHEIVVRFRLDFDYYIGKNKPLDEQIELRQYKESDCQSKRIHSTIVNSFIKTVTIPLDKSTQPAYNQHRTDSDR